MSTTTRRTMVIRTPEPEDDTVEPIIRELEPMMAYQRKAVMRAWQDRSVSKLHMVVLLLLETHGPLPMTRLAAQIDVALSNLTGIVDRMEQHGLVERVRDDRDRRLVLVRATTNGIARCQEIDSLRREQLRRLVVALDSADRAILLQAAQALGRAVARVSADEPSDR